MRFHRKNCVNYILAAALVAIPAGNVKVAAFSPAPSLFQKSLTSFQSPHHDDNNAFTSTTKLHASGRKDDKSPSSSSSSSSSYQHPQTNKPTDEKLIEQQINQALDPACPIEDEDCLTIASLDNSGHILSINHPDYIPPPPTTTPYNSNYNYYYNSLLLVDPKNTNDPLCEVEDVDCQAVAVSTYLHSDTYLSNSFRDRSQSINKERICQNWKSARCPTTFVSVSSEDYVRRVDMDQYPRVACGSARGSVYVVDLERKSVIGSVEGVHSAQVPELNETENSSSSSSDGSGSSSSSNSSSKKRLARRRERGVKKAKQAMEKLYGKLDGGGVVAISIHQDIVASSGREGGVRLWKITEQTNEEEKEEDEGGSTTTTTMSTLEPIGPIPDLKHTIVTSLKFDSVGLLWASGYDGTVRAYDISMCLESFKLPPFPKPMFRTDFTDSVLDMQIREDIGCGVCATADGTAALFSLKDGQFFMGIKLFEVAARSVLIMKDNDDDKEDEEEKKYSVVCGGVDGSIHRVGLNIGAISGRINEENPFDVTESTETAIKPKHTGPVMCLASPQNGMFLSGGQDGALRVWESQQSQCKCLYALTGYKLWLGSACTDFNHLVSDGGENSIIVRDFSAVEDSSSGRDSL